MESLRVEMVELTKLFLRSVLLKTLVVSSEWCLEIQMWSSGAVLAFLRAARGQ